MAGAHADGRFCREKPYLKSLHLASADYSYRERGLHGRSASVCSVVFLFAALVASASRPAASGGPGSIKERVQEWLTYIASDDLQGRAVFGTGIGLAAAYIEDHLRAWGVKPVATSDRICRRSASSALKSASHSTRDR